MTLSNSPAPDDEDRLPLARATIVALYAMAGVALDFATAAPLWLPDLHPVTMDEALRRLAALRAGITCVAASCGRDIGIAAWDGRALNTFKDDALGLLRQDIAERSPRYSPDDYEVTVRAEADGATAQLSWAQYEQWTREFELVAPTIRITAMSRPPGDQPPRLVLTVSPPSSDGWITGTYL